MTQHPQQVSRTFAHPNDAENALIEFIGHGLPGKRPHIFLCDENPNSSEYNSAPDFQKPLMNWGGLI